MLEKISTGLLTLLVAGLAVLMLFIEYRYYDNMLSDVVAFAFTYFLIALIERSPLEKAGVKTWLELVLIFAVLIYALCARVRSCGLYPDADSAFPPILRICGKYSLLNAGLGISVFYLFKKIRMPELPWINAWAKSVFFVFLTHETILALLWRLGILNFRLRYAQPWVRGVKLLAYLALCLLVGWILEKIYHRWIAPVYEKAIRKLLKEDS